MTAISLRPSPLTSPTTAGLRSVKPESRNRGQPGREAPETFSTSTRPAQSVVTMSFVPSPFTSAIATLLGPPPWPYGHPGSRTPVEDQTKIRPLFVAATTSGWPSPVRSPTTGLFWMTSPVPFGSTLCGQPGRDAPVWSKIRTVLP